MLYANGVCAESDSGEYVEYSAEVIQDKIRGGLLGQIIANLNGIKYENKHIVHPGNVTEYVPGLPNGAETDDDTDIEWVYIVAMQEHGLYVPYGILEDIWKRKINRMIWCSHQYVRYLLDFGVPAELTGSEAFNPWAEFNIAGQFTCEMFGQISPCMAQSACRLATYYTRIAVDTEPLQTTLFFSTMIATAFETNDLQRILDAGDAAVDPNSKVAEIIHNTRRWCAEYPDDWKATRKLIHQTYTAHKNQLRDMNGYELNTAATIAALLYGKGDYVQTAIHAFNFGWDADNTAATAGTIIGIMRGEKWFYNQGWNIKDIYINKRRDEMPMNETITSFGDRLVELAEQQILDAGGKIRILEGKKIYNIRTQKPKNVLSLSDIKSIRRQSMEHFCDLLSKSFDLEKSSIPLSGIAYSAIVLGSDSEFKKRNSARWTEALEALNRQDKFLEDLYGKSRNIPSKMPFRDRLSAAGIKYVPPPPLPVQE